MIYYPNARGAVICLESETKPAEEQTQLCQLDTDSDMPESKLQLTAPDEGGMSSTLAFGTLSIHSSSRTWSNAVPLPPLPSRHLQPNNGDDIYDSYRMLGITLEAIDRVRTRIKWESSVRDGTDQATSWNKSKERNGYDLNLTPLLVCGSAIDRVDAAL